MAKVVDSSANGFATATLVENAVVQKESKIFAFLLIVVQVTVLIIYWTVGFEYTLNGGNYGYFRDVNIMIFVGFGFLMTFLRRYGLSAIGYTLILGATVVELSIVWEYLTKKDAGKHVDLEHLFNGLFASGAVMISFGAILGKTTPSQVFLMALVEVPLFFVNFKLAYEIFEVHDCGGGMTIHMFGAYFGLSVCWWFGWSATKHHDDNSSNYTSDITSLVGTLFLWVLWPSFNAAVVSSPEGQLMAIMNTFISLCSSTLAFAVVSRLITEGGKFDTVQLQNATLAGGVAMGVSGDLDIGLHSAVIAGFSAGAVSCLGYAYLTPLIDKLGIQDICGVHNLHGMPGIIATIVSIIAAATRGDDVPRQFYTFLATLGIAIPGGLLTGALMRLLGSAVGIDEFGQANGHREFRDVFNDRAFWVSTSDYDNVINAEVIDGQLKSVLPSESVPAPV